ncbi:hypothetical protein [Candidatus Neoehrlichia procyonis]|uniref:Gram-negative porin family protein n=1 Tax=Candidatus Neoehrlichia procyonis str. RAC413 TaxID=1359163 RepID=A0A0F3NML9_9RICK|nr:hypothetical protein [Candidatus Neoehrlichia lotoris]KJV68952.1 hypothetical protein NLO413_0324 [Candidatus Neoehrlichia lotoris str. RAC413]
MKNLFTISACMCMFLSIYECAFAKHNGNNECIKCQTLQNVSQDYMKYITISGKLMSYNWFIKDNFNNKNVYEYNFDSNFEKWGIDSNGMLEVNLKKYDTNILYGAKFQILMPITKGRIVAFADTPYGYISLGYQEGVESEMKVDAFDIAAGDASSEWTRYIRHFFPVHKGVNNIPFYRSSGLYSENLFRNNGNYFSTDFNLNENDFSGYLPFRFSYKSLNFNGLTFGISYSPKGYKSDFLLNDVMGVINVMGDVDDSNSDYGIVYRYRDVFAPLNNVVISPYTHIISGAISYGYKVNDIKFNASMIGEYGKSITADNAKFMASKYVNLSINRAHNMYIDEPASKHDQLFNEQYMAEYVKKFLNKYMDERYHKLHNLTGIALGINAQYKNLKLGAAYGYLGQSGVIDYNDKFKDLVDVTQYFPKNHAYYWDVGASYQYNNLLLSITYFKSFSYNYYYDNFKHILYRGNNFLKDLGIGIDYTLYTTDKLNCKIFTNYHYFNTNQDYRLYYIDDSNIEKANINKGSIILSGIKIEF